MTMGFWRGVAAWHAVMLLMPFVLKAQARRPDPALSHVPPTPNCADCAAWNVPHAPLRLFGNTYYVGTHGLTALLVTGPDGHVLLDGGLPESAPQILRNIEALGFKVGDIKLIVNSHAHFDHAGGIALIATRSGATVAAMPSSARWMERGTSTDDDPQFGINPGFPKVPRVRVLRDGEVVTVGRLSLTAHLTAGHTPGGTSWTWRSCEASRCINVVYADSQSPMSADGFRFTRSTTYPSGVSDFRRGQALLEQLPCDLVIAPHPGAVRLWERVQEGPAALIDSSGCKRYATAARQALEKRLATEATRR